MIVAINDGVTNGTSNFPDWWTYILNGCTIIRSQFDIGFAVQLIWESLWGGAYLIYDLYGFNLEKKINYQTILSY